MNRNVSGYSRLKATFIQVTIGITETSAETESKSLYEPLAILEMLVTFSFL